MKAAIPISIDDLEQILNFENEGGFIVNVDYMVQMMEETRQEESDPRPKASAPVVRTKIAERNA